MCDYILSFQLEVNTAQDVDEDELTAEEAKERKIMKLLLKVRMELRNLGGFDRRLCSLLLT